MSRDNVTVADIEAIQISPDVPARTVPATQREDAELAASIAQWGVLQPLLLRQRGNQLVLIKGARRLAAARAAGCREVPVKIFAADDPISDAAIRASGMVRASLHPVEVWRATETLLAAGHSMETAAATLGVSARTARQLQCLGRIIPPMLDAMGRTRVPHTHWLNTIAQAPRETQEAAWRQHGKKFTGDWYAVFGACVATTFPRSRAAFDDDAAARHGIIWQEDLFAEGDRDTRHTGDAQAFRAAQLEWMEARVQALIGQGFQAQILDASKTGTPVVGKEFEQVSGREDKAPKNVIRGLWIDTQLAVHFMLYRRRKAEPAKGAKGKASAAAAAAAEPQPETAPKPRGISKKGLVLIAEAKDRALAAALSDAEWHEEAAPDQVDNCAVLLHALLVALTASNVQVQHGASWQRVLMDELLPELLQPDGRKQYSDFPPLIRQARKALGMMLQAPRPERFGSGQAFDRVANIIGAKNPRCDSEDILAELPKAVLVSLATQHGQPAKAGVKELARQLAGKLDRWQPKEAEFTPTPLDGADEAEPTEAELEDAA